MEEKDFLEGMEKTDAKLKLVQAISLIAEVHNKLPNDKKNELDKIWQQLEDFELNL